MTVQLASACLLNGYAEGFIKGKLFTGSAKGVCVPVLNCYSCPGALGSCPIGALQAVSGGAAHNIPFYAAGMITLFGILLGRLFCGFMCPFGFIQDLLYKIPVRKAAVRKEIDRPARKIKYAIALVSVILLPVVITNPYGSAEPYFCKFICPAGTLEGGLPMLAANESLRTVIGALFSWKAILLCLILIFSMMISRFFCKYLCPLGAIYSIFNKCSFYRLKMDKELCTGCGRCSSTCPMDIEVEKNINSPECIRCGRCKAACPHKAIT